MAGRGGPTWLEDLKPEVVGNHPPCVPRARQGGRAGRGACPAGGSARPAREPRPGVSAPKPTWSHGCPELTASGAFLVLAPASLIPRLTSTSQNLMSLPSGRNFPACPSGAPAPPQAGLEPCRHYCGKASQLKKTALLLLAARWVPSGLQPVAEPLTAGGLCRDVAAQLQVAAPPTPRLSEPGVGGGGWGTGHLQALRAPGEEPFLPPLPTPTQASGYGATGAVLPIRLPALPEGR